MKILLKTSIFILANTLLYSCDNKGVNLADLNLERNQYCDSKARPVSGKAYELVQSKFKQIGGIFDKKVNLYSEGYLINGKKEGAWESPRGWFLDGKQIKAMETISYKNNLAHGPTVVINTNTDDTLSYIEYHRARKHGEYSTFFSNGQYEYKYYYQMGKEHGEQRRYRKDGLLLSKEEFKDGVPHGQHIRANEKTGLLEEIKNYRDGTLHGTFIKYHPNGRKFYKKVYSSGTLFNTRWYNTDGSEMPEFEKGVLGKWKKQTSSKDKGDVIIEFTDKLYISKKEEAINHNLGQGFIDILTGQPVVAPLNARIKVTSYYSSKTGLLIESDTSFYFFEGNFVRTQFHPAASGFHISHLDDKMLMIPKSYIGKETTFETYFKITD